MSNLSAQSAELYHLGNCQVTRKSLARFNEHQSHVLYESLFHKLSRCQGIALRHSFRFKNKLYSLDASTIDLCLYVFSWAKLSSTKGAVGLHVGPVHDGLIASWVTIIDGKCGDVTAGRALDLTTDRIFVMDRAYIDYS